jgi:peptidoglycan/LPS O-acetylase OafA/YrhL
MVILLVITVSIINIHIKKNKFRRIIEFFGYYSLEFYLIYESVYLASTGLFKASDGAGISYAAACFSVSILLSIALKQSVNHIMNFIRKDNNE